MGSSKKNTVLYTACVNLFLSAVVSVCGVLEQLLPHTLQLEIHASQISVFLHGGIDALRKRETILQAHHSLTHVPEKTWSDKVIRKALC